MGDASAIQWTDATWNCVVGCSRVSPGCENCYAERFVHRGLHASHRGLTVMRAGAPGWTGEVRLVPEALVRPLRWKRGRRVFVNSLSDLFHERLPFESIAAVFGVMAACPQHTFQILTKRPKRARAFFAWVVERCNAGATTPYDVILSAKNDIDAELWESALERAGIDREDVFEEPWPLPHVWLGVTAEDQQRADERIPVLLETPAAVRFVSYEPALGPVDLRPYLGCLRCAGTGSVSVPGGGKACGACFDWAQGSPRPGPHLDWVIAGGESGPRARPFDLAWARATINGCRAAGVPAFFKQAGAEPRIDGLRPLAIRARNGDDMQEWPEALRVRDFPTVRP